MLRTLKPEQKERWKEYVKPLVHAYNCTKNEVTGYTPYKLMFGRSQGSQMTLLLDYQSVMHRPLPILNMSRTFGPRWRRVTSLHPKMQQKWLRKEQNAL